MTPLTKGPGGNWGGTLAGRLGYDSMPFTVVLDWVLF